MRSAGLTKNQRAVFSVLEQAETPLSAYQILDDVRAHGLRAPLQVYRALEKLTSQGLIHRIETLNAFVICSHPPHPEPAGFVICAECGKAAELSLQGCEAHLTASARKKGFRVETVKVEMTGCCPQCTPNK